MKRKTVITVLAIIILVLIGGTVYSYVEKKQIQNGVVLPKASFFEPKERPSPNDWVKEEQIHVYNDKVVIEIANPEWAAFSDTNSMDPLIDQGTNAIEIVPQSEEDIHVGDVVSYESEYADGIIIHRVAKIGKDEKGTYYVLKGDNNPDTDPGKVRFSQIKRILVAVIY